MYKYKIKQKLNYVGHPYHVLMGDNGDGEGFCNLGSIKPENLQKFIAWGGTFEDSEKITKYKSIYNL